jgi:hypothetical protein
MIIVTMDFDTAVLSMDQALSGTSQFAMRFLLSAERKPIEESRRLSAVVPADRQGVGPS